jgi:eukaryotic-like serine/threonine-protein kinase
VADDPLLLGGRYELGAVIGYGGMAEVHRGRDVRLGRDVAVKVLRADLGRDPTFQGRFRQEAQSAASLNSPLIVAVYDTGEATIGGAATPYIVMEYVDGQTLRELLADEGRLLPARALEITAAVCTALEQAHLAGIVHRDIKPGNVMLTTTGRVKVMDFGIARALTASSATMTQTATVVGTAHYLSPEQARGEHVDARSDVYSTGCLLFELLTGAPPFTGDTAVSVAYQHVREEPMPPSSVEPDIGPGIDAIVLVAMAKDPADRYASAAQMRDDIDRALSGQPVQAAPVPHHDGDFVAPASPTTVLVRDPPQRRRGFAYALLAIATIGVFILALVAARSVLGHTAVDVNTPDVTHESLENARATLLAQGLVMGPITHQFTGANNSDEVLAQVPPAGSLLRTGQSVSLTVSLGVRLVDVPSGLVGQTLSQARASIAAAGLTVGRIVSRNSDNPAGQVLKYKPAAGTSIAAGTPITLYVSNSHVKVPKVTGKDPADATEILQQDGFNPDLRTSSIYIKHQDGLIVAQTPTGGTYAATGSEVIIYVDAKKPKPHNSPSPSNSASGSPAPSNTPTSSNPPT